MIRSLLRKHYALPSEHGAWVWLAGPFALGAAAGPSASPDLLLLALAGVSAFLLRQPVSIVVKVLSGRRGRQQLVPGLIWSAGYALLCAGLLLILWNRGHSRVLLLAVPGAPVFIWHLWLVRGRQERDRPGVEIVAAGVLALMAPAAYWVSTGDSALIGWLLWGISWFHSAGSIVGVHLRLRQRRLEGLPPIATRLQMGWRSLAYHLFNLAAALTLSLLVDLPPLVLGGYAVTLVDALEGALRPAMGARPGAIGRRQLVVSAAFYLLAGVGLAGWQPPF